MIAARVAASVSVMLLAVVNTGFGREWKDASGEHSRTGEFLACRDGKVIVRLPDGKEASAALERFCAADQAYVQDLLKGGAERGAIPAKLAAQSVQARTATYVSGGAPADRLAQATPPNATTQQVGSLPAPGDSSAGAAKDAKPRFIPGGTKRVFYADCGRFHIFIDQEGVMPIIGTAHYALRYWWPPCCCCSCCCPCEGPWFLSFLRFYSFDGKWLWADEVGVASPGRWAFAYFSMPCGHPIWYFENKVTPHFFGYASWAHPK